MIPWSIADDGLGRWTDEPDDEPLSEDEIRAMHADWRRDQRIGDELEERDWS